MSNNQNLIPFYFGEKTIRTALINDEPWFVATDVCDILGQTDSQTVIEILDDDEKGIKKVYSHIDYQDINIINESGLYNLIFQSSKPETKVFRKWVTVELLPALRRKGYYGAAEGECSDRKLKMLLRAYARKIINSTQFNFLIGMPPEDFQLEEIEPKITQAKAFNTAIAGDHLRDFIEKSISFEESAVTAIQKVYDAYLAYYDFDITSVLSGEALSRHQFTRWMLPNYRTRIREKIIRVDGKLSRCFQGVKLLSLDDMAVE